MSDIQSQSSAHLVATLDPFSSFNQQKQLKSDEKWNELIDFAHTTDGNLKYGKDKDDNNDDEVSLVFGKDEDSRSPSLATVASHVTSLVPYRSHLANTSDTATSFFSRLKEKLGLESNSCDTNGECKRSYATYEVSFTKGPIGLNLETDWYGRHAVVKGFQAVHGVDGPAKSCGLIRIGDILTHINTEPCQQWPFQEILAKLKEISAETHQLTFKVAEYEGSSAFLYHLDPAIVEAKRHVHQTKQIFHIPPTPLEIQDNSMPSPSSETGGNLSTSATNGQNRREFLVLGCVERLKGPNVTTFNFYKEGTGEFLLAGTCANDCTGDILFHTLQDAHLREFKNIPQEEDSAVYLGKLSSNVLGTEFILCDHQQQQRNEIMYLEYTSNWFGHIPNILKCVLVNYPEASPAESTIPHDRSISDSQLLARMFPPSQLTQASSMRELGHSEKISKRYKRQTQSRRWWLSELWDACSIEEIEAKCLEIAGKFDIKYMINFNFLDKLPYEDRIEVSRPQKDRQRSSSVGAYSNTGPDYYAIEQEDHSSELYILETRLPIWNETLQAWTLNFHGRVKIPSKKNFLLIESSCSKLTEDHEDQDAPNRKRPKPKTLLRFGKISKHRFALDYQAPLSPFMALAIACSAFAYKVAVA